MVQVRMLLALGGYRIGEVIDVEEDLVDLYVAAGYVERVEP
jgi:hypothetical protein